MYKLILNIYLNNLLKFKNSIGTVKSLLECLTDKLANYLSKNFAELKYFREPDKKMKQRAYLLSEQNITRDAMVPDMFQYHKLDKSNPEKSI